MKNIFLAEDDDDDRLFFEDALKEVSNESELTTAKDGVELMTKLNAQVPPPPDIIFLDLNMPRKNGYECLKEIREMDKLRKIPVVIFSTSDHDEIVNTTYSMGANLYLRKPHSYDLLKNAIQQVLTLELWNGGVQRPREQFFFGY